MISSPRITSEGQNGSIRLDQQCPAPRSYRPSPKSLTAPRSQFTVVNRPRLGTLTRVKNSFIFPIQQCDVGSYWGRTGEQKSVLAETLQECQAFADGVAPVLNHMTKMER